MLPAMSLAAGMILISSNSGQEICLFPQMSKYFFKDAVNAHQQTHYLVTMASLRDVQLLDDLGVTVMQLQTAGKCSSAATKCPNVRRTHKEASLQSRSMWMPSNLTRKKKTTYILSSFPDNNNGLKFMNVYCFADLSTVPLHVRCILSISVVFSEREVCIVYSEFSALFSVSPQRLFYFKGKKKTNYKMFTLIL